MFTILIMLGTCLIAVGTLMVLFWCLYLIKDNVSIIDIGWGLGFITTAIIAFILGEGFFWRRVLVLSIVSIWALRLVYHIASRFNPEMDDPRYQLVLKKWPYAQYPDFQVLTLYSFQGLLIVILSLPFILMSQDVLPFFTTTEVFGLLLWMGGITGETVADRQLQQFKENPTHKGQVCEWGLWQYSRHPNYFFEWVIWLGFSLMAFSAPFGWLSIISPLLMLYLLLKVSGIPLNEAHALQSRGEAYSDYQKRTSPFFPWFSRQSHTRDYSSDHQTPPQHEIQPTVQVKKLDEI